MWPLRVLNHRAAIAPLALASVLLTAQAPLPEPVTDTETELGQAVYDELKTKGEIIASSPLYDTLGPVVEPIAKVAQAHYEHRASLQILPGPRSSTQRLFCARRECLRD